MLWIGYRVSFTGSQMHCERSTLYSLKWRWQCKKWFSLYKISLPSSLIIIWCSLPFVPCISPVTLIPWRKNILIYLASASSSAALSCDCGCSRPSPTVGHTLYEVWKVLLGSQQGLLIKGRRAGAGSPYCQVTEHYTLHFWSAKRF